MNLLEANALGQSHLAVGDAAVAALLGYAIVFLGLILLMIVVIIVGKIFTAKDAKKKAAAPAAAPAAPVVTGAGDPVNAPMPGTILKVNVTANQTVKAGTVLCVLEAMKMENEIMAPKDGTVTQVLVSNGSKVDTGAPLVVLA